MKVTIFHTCLILILVGFFLYSMSVSIEKALGGETMASTSTIVADAIHYPSISVCKKYMLTNYRWEIEILKIIYYYII